MGGAVLIVLILLAVIAVFYFRYKQRQARITAVTTLGRRNGFTFTLDDADDIVDMPFALFDKGDGRRVELVLSGQHNGRPLRLFDYRYYEETSTGKGGRSRSYYRFTCGLLTIPAACPALRIGHEGFFTRLGQHFGLHDVTFESDDFNQQFRVKCDDQRFAFCVIDGQMMEWLMSADSFEAVEIVGPWVLCAVPQLDPAEWLDIGTWLDLFHAHIPEIVFSEYPPR